MNDDALLSVSAKLTARQEESSVVDIFSRHAIASGGTLYTPKGKARGSAEYRACEVEKSARNRAEWLDIRLTDGTSFGLPYHLLTEMCLSSPQNLSLIYASHVVTLTGRHLGEVKQAMQRGKLISITCFDPSVHAVPPETEIVITSITRQTIQEYVTG